MTLLNFELVAAASLALSVGCASSPSSSGAEGGEDALSTLGRDLVGEYLWSATDSGAPVDFEHVDLKADGTYTAKVEATLVNPGVRYFHARCTLPEHGVWNAYKVQGKTKLRVRPTTGRARVYAAARSNDEQLTLSRRGETTTLFRKALSCVDGRCAGTPSASPLCIQDPAARVAS